MLLSVIKKYKIINILALAIILFFLYFQLLYWQRSWIGWILLIGWLFFSGQLWQDILRRVFGLNRKIVTTKIFATLSAFFLLGIFSAICLVFYRLTPLIFFYIYLTVTVFSYLLHQLLQKIRVVNDEIVDEANENLVFLKSSYLILLIYLIAWLGAFYWLTLVNHPTTAVAWSPWQIIDNQYLLLFFVLTILSGLFLLAKYKIKVILLVIVMQTLLLHLYLPLSHQLPWGGDVWRHLSIENQLNNGQQILPVLFGDNAEWKEVVNVKLPAVFFNPQKYAYGHLWGTSILLTKTLVIDLLNINKWLMPILWSLALPFLLFRIGWLLFGFRRAGLWLAWLSLLPFPLQALGSLTLPVSLGFLLFLFTLMLWLQYWQTGEVWQRRLAVLFSCLMLFGYTLYFIIIWTLVIMYYASYIMKQFLTKKIQNSKFKFQIVNRIIEGFIFVFAICILPTVELITNVSRLPSSINWFSNLKQLIGQFSGWYYAILIRPHDILSGNLIFNHTPDYAFVTNIFNNWRWWLIPAMMIVWSLVVLAVYKIFKIGDKRYEIIGLLFSIIFGGYVIGWFVLDGDRIFTRRLDVLVAFLIIVLFFKSLSLINFKFQISNFKFLPKLILIFFIIGLSWFTTFTYASGPDMRVVSMDEYNTAQFINNKIQDTSYKIQTNIQYPISNIQSCVLTDTWVLLPLEALSRGTVIGGGFPIDYQFGQPERVAMFNKFSTNPEVPDLQKMKQLTGSNQCWFAQNGNNLDLDKISKVMNNSPEQVGEIFVWKDLPAATLNVGLKKERK